MKKQVASILLCLTACILLSFSASALEKTDYGYYDCNADGTIGLADAISALNELLNTEDADFSFLRILHICKAIPASQPMAAKVTAANASTVTFASLYASNIALPRTALDPDATITVGQDATLLVHAPLSAAFENYTGDGRGIYGVQLDKKTEETPVTELLSIRELNTNSQDGSHTSDNYLTASLEINYREHVTLSYATTSQARYQKAHYPRVKKVKDDLYVMFWMYGQLGQHLYYATSEDGLTWNAPKVLWDAAKHPVTYADGSLQGETDQYFAVNADACVLQNGEILCVFAVRPTKGYKSDEYIDLHGMYMLRGTVQTDNTIKWSSAKKIYTGHLWEPFIFQRSDGQIEIYWSSIVGYIEKYGFDDDKRSTCTTMIVSNDNGKTWTPNIQPGAASYVAKRIFQQGIGNKVPAGNYTTAVPYFGGQMPSAVQLCNGKTLLAVEVQQLDKSYDISMATSKDGGAWDALGLTQTGPSTKKENLFDGAAPYLARFPSGEVLLTYNTNSTFYGKMVSPDGQKISSTPFEAAPGVSGFWGASEVVGSHAIITTYPYINKQSDDTYDNALHLFYSYLNHRVNAKKISVNVDGYTNDWENNTDALFVGSASQAQITLQTAHDKNNLYFLIRRADNSLKTADTAIVYIASGASSYYSITLDTSGNYTVQKSGSSTTLSSGTTAVKKVTGGIVIECAIPKSAVGLASATAFQVAPALKNTDSSAAAITDMLTGITTSSTANWPSVILD